MFNSSIKLEQNIFVFQLYSILFYLIVFEFTVLVMQMLNFIDRQQHWNNTTHKIYWLKNTATAIMST